MFVADILIGGHPSALIQLCVHARMNLQIAGLFAAIKADSRFGC